MRNYFIKIMPCFLLVFLAACGDNGATDARLEYPGDDGEAMEPVESSSSEQKSSSKDASSSSAKSSSSVKSSSSEEASSSSEEVESSSSVAPADTTILVDSRDGKWYRTVKIGGQTWMAENLNYEMDGEGSYCFEDSVGNCAAYGRFYTWPAAMSACPSGWHLPAPAEFEELFSAVGGELEAGKMLKSRSGWSVEDAIYDPNGVDAYSFTVLPVGSMNRDGEHTYFYKRAYFWTTKEYGSAEYQPKTAYVFYFTHLGEPALCANYNKFYYAFSIRCLRNW